MNTETYLVALTVLYLYLEINYSTSRGLKLKVPRFEISSDDVPFHLSTFNFGLMSLNYSSLFHVVKTRGKSV